MIRRSPTRIELKLEDMQEIEFVQKSDRRKAILAAGGSTGIDEVKKLRQERVGLQGTGPQTRPSTASGGTGSRRIAQSGGVTVPTVQPRPSTAAATAQPTTSTPIVVARAPTHAENIGGGDMDLVDMSIDSPVAGN